MSDARSIVIAASVGSSIELTRQSMRPSAFAETFDRHRYARSCQLLLVTEGSMPPSAFSAHEFRAGTYHGRRFALMRHHHKWRVFLDDRLLASYFFETAEEATRWLQREIEGQFAE